jgi:hypothetical protein
MGRWTIAVAATLTVWCGAELALRRTAAITDDHHGWRQADTQAIARNLAFEEFAPLYPRIDWRGDGPGYVETEWQLYPTLIASVMLVIGETIWPGQLISLASVAVAALLVYVALARRFGPPAAYVGLLALLTCQGVIVVGTSIQPDPLAFLAYTVGFLAFAAWLAEPTNARLGLWITATTIAGLVKPTTLELGITQGVLVLLTSRAALRRPALWIGWAIVLIAVAAFLVHARGLYIDYGNTFGVLSGGDSKLPALERVLDLRTWIDLVRFVVIWGIGIPAVPAGLYLAVRGRVGAEEIALAAGALVLSLIALRYASGPFGTHYHLPHVLLGAWLVARAAAAIEPRISRRTLVAAAIAVAVLLDARALRYLRQLPPEPETAVGQLLARAAPPGTRVVVRARAPRRDPEWHSANNFEDPRVFYLSRTHGWAIANDDDGAAPLADTARRGARFYAHVEQRPPDAELDAWLAEHATLVDRTPAGRIYRLDGAARSSRTK